MWRGLVNFIRLLAARAAPPLAMQLVGGREIAQLSVSVDDTETFPHMVRRMRVTTSR